MTLIKRVSAELLGTFWLVFGGCGSAVFAAAFPDLGIGFAGVSLAFGLTVVSGVYAFAHISGANFNPAVTLGLFAAGRIRGGDVLPYIVAQLIGALLAAWLIACIASGNGTDAVAAGLAANGYGEHSPGHYSQAAAFIAEAVLTFFFLTIILGSTDERAQKALAPLAIGLTLTLIHLISIPITNTSVNPARSTGPALLVGGWALSQLWLFWIAPVAGAIGAGVLYRWFAAPK
jgi:aquaporin Z